MTHEARDLYAEQEFDLLLKAHRQEECCCHLILRQALEGEDRDPRIHAANFCMHRWTCPFCAAQLGAKKASHYAPRLADLRLSDPRRRVHFLTFTVRDGPDLRETFEILDRALKKLHKRWENAKRGKSRSTLRAIKAMLGQVEVKRGSGSGLWHPHFHALVVTDEYLDYAELREVWAECVGDPQAWSKFMPCHTEKRLREGGREWNRDELRAAFMKDLSEVIKYPFKIETDRPQDAWFCWSVLQSKRMTRTWGEIRQKAFDELNDEPLDWDQIKFVERMLSWNGEAYDVQELPNGPERYTEFD